MPTGVYKHKTIDVNERFWPKVDKRGVDECWEWNAHKNHKGYGTFQYQGQHLAHRVSWIIEHGEIQDGLEVLHRCDNRGCVNPHHLFLGTQIDNILDMRSKGRAAKIPKGENALNCRLNNSQVIAIRNMYKGRRGGKRMVDIAVIFGVSKSTISNVILKRTYADVDETPALRPA
jgi:hypothetical protein